MGTFNEIIEKLKNQLNAEIDNIFQAVPEEKLSVLTDLYGTFSYWSSIYSEDELAELKNYYIPDMIIDFYKIHSPIEDISLEGYVNLLSLESIKRENSELAPGSLLIKYGLVTFATTIGGNAICMDLNKINNGEPRIVIADHSVFGSKDITIFETDAVSKTVQMKSYMLNYEVIFKYCPEICKTFSSFLEKLSNKEYEDIEDFLQ